MNGRTRRDPAFVALAASPACVLVALPFGDVSDGLNVVLAPLVAATATFFVAKRPSIWWSIFAAFLTEVLLVIALGLIVVIWGI